MQKIVLDDIKYDLVIFKYRAFIKDPFKFLLSCQVFGFSKLETHFHRLAEGRNEVNGMRKKPSQYLPCSFCSLTDIPTQKPAGTGNKQFSHKLIDSHIIFN